MLRSLGVYTALRWFIVAVILVAVWRSYNGNIGDIATAVWHWILLGSDVAVNIWHSLTGAQK